MSLPTPTILGLCVLHWLCAPDPHFRGEKIHDTKLCCTLFTTIANHTIIPKLKTKSTEVKIQILCGHCSVLCVTKEGFRINLKWEKREESFNY